MLAIIIPYYKDVFFEQTLTSLANQTNKDFVVYIGDDASPSNCLPIINKFKDNLNISYKRFDQNFGSKSLVNQWKRCISLLKDENWFIILGDDDLLEENYIECFYNIQEIINQSSINLVRYSSVEIDDNNKKVSKKFTHPEYELSIDSLFRKLNGSNRSSLSEYVFKNSENITNIFIDFPNAYYSDDLSLLLATNFRTIYTVNASIFYFRKGNYNLSGVNSDYKKANEAEFLFYKYLLKHHREKFTNYQKKIFLFKLDRLFIRNKSVQVFIFVLLEKIKILDFKGLMYLPLLLISKVFKD